MWSIKAWRSAEPIYLKILEHPFIEELAAGTLCGERFKFYIAQDVIYLSRLAKSISKLAPRLLSDKNRGLFEKFASETMQIEQSMQSQYGVGVGLEEPTIMSNACVKYTEFEAYNAEFEDVAVALASMLPCYWIYKSVGDSVVQSATLEANPYAGWIALYSDNYFAQEVAQFIAICDEYALNSSEEIRERMIKAFVKSTQFEYDFWNDAYNK